MILTRSSNEGRDRKGPDALSNVAHEVHEPGGRVGLYTDDRPGISAELDRPESLETIVNS